MSQEKAKRDFKPKNRPRNPLHLVLLTMIIGSFVVIIIAFGLSIWLKTDPFTPSCEMSEHLQYASTWENQLTIHTLNHESPIVLNLSDPQNLKWSADGTKLGLIDYQQNIPQGNFMILDIHGNILNQLEKTFDYLVWWSSSADFRYFAFSYRVENDRWNLLLWDSETDTTTDLLPESAETRPNMTWSPDGTKLLYNYRIIHDTPDSQVLLLNSSTGDIQPIFETTKRFQLPNWVDNETLTYERDGMFYLYNIETAESEWLDTDNTYSNIGFSPNNRYFLYRTDERLSVFDLQTRDHYIHRIDTDLQFGGRYEWFNESNRLMAIHDTRELDRIYRVDIISGEIEFLAEAQYFTDFVWSPDDRYLFYIVGYDRDQDPNQYSIAPGQFYLLDTKTDELTELQRIQSQRTTFRHLPNDEMGFVYSLDIENSTQQPNRFLVRNLTTDSVCQLGIYASKFSRYQWRPVGMKSTNL